MSSGHFNKRLLRRVRSELRSDVGFTLVEALISATLFLVITTALMGVLTAGIGSHNLARERTMAEQSATAELEAIRQLTYDRVGLQGGNPPGQLQATKPVTYPKGLQGTVTTQVSFVSDPTPTSYATQANYKKVTVTIKRTDGKVLAQQVTYVAPTERAPYGGINNAIINVTVVDYDNTPVQGATVKLSQGPPGSTDRTDLTTLAGLVTFPALTPTTGSEFYDLAVSATGYETLSDDVPIHVQLSPSQTLAKTIHVYKGSTIQVNVTDALGNPYPSEVTVYVGSTDRGKAGGSVTFQNACGCTTISTLGGEKVVPGSYTVTAVARVGALYFFSPASAQATQNVPNAYPTNLTKSFTAKLPLAAVPVTTVTVTVRQGATPLGNARVDISGGAGPSFVTGTTTSGGTNDGKVTLTVPSGSNYKITAWDSSGTLTGQLTNVSFSSGSASSTVQVS